MKRHITIFALTALAVCAVRSSLAGFIKIESRYNGHLFTSTVSDTNLASSPSWEKQQPNPPLPPRKALSIARGFLADAMDNSEAWSLESVALKNFRDDKWYYVITFILGTDGFTNLPSPTIQIVVLMDGKIATLRMKSKPPTRETSEPAPRPVP